MFDRNQLITELYLLLTREKKDVNPYLLHFSTMLTDEEKNEILDHILDDEEMFRNGDRSQAFKTKLNDLMWHIDESTTPEQEKKPVRTQTELAKRVGISKQALSKIFSYKDKTLPTRTTLIKLCLALELTKEQALSLLQTIGYSIKIDSVFEVIAFKCIEFRIYDLNEIYELVSEMDRKFKTSFSKQIEWED